MRANLPGLLKMGPRLAYPPGKGPRGGLTPFLFSSFPTWIDFVQRWITGFVLFAHGSAVASATETLLSFGLHRSISLPTAPTLCLGLRSRHGVDHRGSSFPVTGRHGPWILVRIEGPFEPTVSGLLLPPTGPVGEGSRTPYFWSGLQPVYTVWSPCQLRFTADSTPPTLGLLLSPARRAGGCPVPCEP